MPKSECSLLCIIDPDLFINLVILFMSRIVMFPPQQTAICKNTFDMYTLNINQSNVSTKLKKHDFVIPEIEVTSQLIDLRSSETLCEALTFDHDLAGGGNSKVQLSVMCRVVFDTLIAF